MMFSDLPRRLPRELLVHLVHAVILLLPTMVLVPSRGLEPVVVCFAIGIMLAALLESVVVSRRDLVDHQHIQDKVAMRVASVVGVCILATFWVAQIEHLFSAFSSAAIHVEGAIVLVLGVGLRVEAIRTLGPRFVSDIRVDGMVVRDGIYAWLRHPSEVGLLLIVAGGPLLLGSPITATVATIVLLPVSIWRMHREDVAISSL